MSVFKKKLGVIFANTDGRKFMTLEAIQVIDTIFEWSNPDRHITSMDLKSVCGKKQNLSRIVAFLEAHGTCRGQGLGWVKQVRNSKDRRINDIMLTSKGLEVRKQYMAVDADI